ncbi:MAG: hypothetical protein CVU73_12675 [Deltaproteobacteria bacterium HGW-Deltaproteobacteria-8]|jgi:hypothetical protein|nr:MAG: hypothetical protein CVU73_12675 [Deltaproteobacteria bacterium HGW-Deltaproteobacteria-8]
MTSWLFPVLGVLGLVIAMTKPELLTQNKATLTRRNLAFLKVFFVLFALITGVVAWNTSGGQSKKSPPLPAMSDVTPQDSARIQAAWPRILAQCPGLTKYWSSLEFKGVEQFPECSTALKFKVTEEPGHFPAEYRSWGHNCWLCISDDGSTLTIWKASCQELFMDKVIPGATDHNLVLPLK